YYANLGNTSVAEPKTVETRVVDGKVEGALAPTITPTPSPLPTLSPTPVPTSTPAAKEIYEAPTAVYIPPTQPQTGSQLDNNNYYTNVDGNQVHSPANSVDGGAPAGATAKCA